jgi:hypothetical protein
MKTPMELIEDKLNELDDSKAFHRWVILNQPMLVKREKLLINAETNRLCKKTKTDNNVVLNASFL